MLSNFPQNIPKHRPLPVPNHIYMSFCKIQKIHPINIPFYLSKIRFGTNKKAEVFNDTQNSPEIFVETLPFRIRPSSRFADPSQLPGSGPQHEFCWIIGSFLLQQKWVVNKQPAKFHHLSNGFSNHQRFTKPQWFSKFCEVKYYTFQIYSFGWLRPQVKTLFSCCGFFCWSGLMTNNTLFKETDDVCFLSFEILFGWFGKRGFYIAIYEINSFDKVLLLQVST